MILLGLATPVKNESLTVAAETSAEKNKLLRTRNGWSFTSKLSTFDVLPQFLQLHTTNKIKTTKSLSETVIYTRMRLKKCHNLTTLS